MELNAVTAIVTALAGHLIGSFPTGVFITKRKYGIDVREMGSGNIGATNVTRVFGWYAGVLVFVIDFLKGWGPLYLYHRYVSEEPLGLAVLAGALVLGHCFSVFLKGKGGKGVATGFGCITFVAPWCALICGVVYFSLLLLTRISAVGSLGGVVAASLYLLVAQPPQSISILILGIVFIITVRHHQNIKRLIHTYKQKKGKKK